MRVSPHVISTRLNASQLTRVRHFAAARGVTVAEHIRLHLLAASEADSGKDPDAALLLLKEALGLDPDATAQDVLRSVQEIVAQADAPADGDALGDNAEAPTPAAQLTSTPNPYTERERAGAAKLGISPAEFRHRKELAVRSETARPKTTGLGAINDRNREGAKKLSSKLGRKVTPEEFAQMKREAVRTR
jgi:hypothetical protein